MSCSRLPSCGTLVGVTGGGVDEEARADVVGPASARLLAAGIENPALADMLAR